MAAELSDPAAGAPTDDEIPPAMVRCCCIWIPWPSRRHPPPTGGDWWQRVDADGDGAGYSSAASAPQPPWWISPLMKAREWSELTAGPRWKTFIRRFNRVGGGKYSRGDAVGRSSSARFHYSPFSYALNFDGGDEDDEAASGGRITGFSDRWAARPAVEFSARGEPLVFSAGH